jgi:hypothetical protein
MHYVESIIPSPKVNEWQFFFNWSISYTLDADFGGEYSKFLNLEWASKNESASTDFGIDSDKKKFSFALISNCRSNNRLDYLNELKKHIPVDIYGKCGRECSKNPDCRYHLLRSYKFFFAFENSFCTNYITEKFFLAIKYPIIPVVRGFGKYDDYVSCISKN